MTQDNPPKAPVDKTDPGYRSRARMTPIIYLLVIACIAIPYLFWKGTWFGGTLTDEQIRTYLTSADEPRRTQHALVQITERMEQADGDARSFYALIPPLAEDKRYEIRATAAWVMGRDSSEAPFHEALAGLLADEVPLVSRNAALALSNFGDTSARPVLLTMLSPLDARCGVSGTISHMLSDKSPVRAGMHMGTVTAKGGEVTRVFTPVGGQVIRVHAANGDTVSADDLLYTISPAEADMWEALRALVRVGAPEDIPGIRAAVAKYFPTGRVHEQSELTCTAIEQRAALP